MPARRQMLLRLLRVCLLVLAVAMLCSSRLLRTISSSLLAGRRGEVLLVGGRGDGAVGGGVVA